MQRFFRIQSWLLHHLLEIDEYSIHSPFLFDLYTNCIKKAGKQLPVDQFERIRKSALNDRRRIHTGEWGSSVTHRIHSISISNIARFGITRAKYSLLYREIIRYFHFSNIVELGTSIGINTIYLAGSAGDCFVHTFEGNPELIQYARNNYQKAGVSNIRIIEGDIDDQLPRFTDSGMKSQFILFDANHRYEPTMKYFKMLNRSRAENAVFVFDDIHWSREMLKAWNDIRKHPDVKIDLDLYQAGILIFDPLLPKISERLAIG